MALGLDQPEDNVMKRHPRHPREGIFARGLGWKVVSRGFLIGAATLAAFMIVYDNDPDRLQYAQTIAFATLVMAQLIHVFDCRSEVRVATPQLAREYGSSAIVVGRSITKAKDP